MGLSLLPQPILNKYEVHEWKHACAILKGDYASEFDDIINVLSAFKLRRSQILSPGGGKSSLAKDIDAHFKKLGWKEKGFDTKLVIDGKPIESPTHKVDCYKDGIALELEWNNKTEFYDRDLNNFRLLFELRVIGVGVIITRADELQTIFDSLGKGPSYGATTTIMSKLIRKINGGGGGGCPILAFGITKKLYVED